MNPGRIVPQRIRRFIIGCRSGDRIETSGMKRMTPHKPSEGEDAAFECAVTRYCFIGIVGTGWIETASVAQYGGKGILVEPNQYQKQLFNDGHGSVCQKYFEAMKKKAQTPDLRLLF